MFVVRVGWVPHALAPRSHSSEFAPFWLRPDHCWFGQHTFTGFSGKKIYGRTCHIFMRATWYARTLLVNFADHDLNT